MQSNMRPMPWVRSLATGLLACAAATLPMLARADASLTTSSPRGEVALVRQVRATFSESMVKFGDPRLPAPLDVTCTPGGTQAGTARWVDDKTWVFDFAKDLPPGTRCSVAPHPGIKSVAGAAIAADARFDFSTGGPAVVRAYPSPSEYSRIEEEQAFALLLNGAATTDSIERFAYCEFAGVGERVPVKLITGPTRDAILKAVNLVPQQARSVTLQCARPAAPESKVSLVWGKGIATATGVASSCRRPAPELRGASRVHRQLHLRARELALGLPADAAAARRVLVAGAAPDRREDRAGRARRQATSRRSSSTAARRRTRWSTCTSPACTSSSTSSAATRAASPATPRRRA